MRAPLRRRLRRFSREASNHLFINFSFMIQLANLFIN